jgi:HSP20 family protein
MNRSPSFDGSELDSIIARMSRQLEELAGQFDGPSVSRCGAAVDLRDEPDSFVVSVDLPGFERSDIDLSVADRTLTIDATRAVSHDAAGDDGRFVRQERRTDSIHRSLRLPADVRADDAAATYNNGVLSVTLPKLTVDGGDSRRIDIE